MGALLDRIRAFVESRLTDSYFFCNFAFNFKNYQILYKTMNETTTDEESSCTPSGELFSLDEKVSSGQELAVIFNKMTRLLKETRRKTKDAPIEIFGDFYHQLRSFHDDEAVTTAYEDWKMNVGKLTFECLKEKQTLTVAEFLEKGVLRYSREPSERELAEVRLDLVKMHMPCRYRYSKDFKLQCAVFRRFISWDGDILIIDYDSWGKYLFQFFFSLTYEERFALFVLDRTLQLIHEDMKRLMNRKAESVQQEVKLTPEQDNIIIQLKPMFFGNEDEVKDFLINIKGMKPKNITDVVNRLVDEKKLSELSCHRELYKVLYDNGIYTKSESNWNMQVR